MGPPAPELTRGAGGRGNHAPFLRPCDPVDPGGRKAAVSFHMALGSGKGASPVEAKPLS